MLGDLERDIQDRHERYQMRKERFRQLHGILDARDFPWTDAANFHIPIMMIAGLRTSASLENATKSMRPLMNSKAVASQDTAKQARVDSLLDYQFFVENRGQSFIDDFSYNFIHDEAAFAFTPWVRETQTVHEIRVQEPLDPTADHIAQILIRLPDMFEGAQPVMTDKDGWVWDVDYVDRNAERAKATVEFYERDDDKVEAVVIKKIQTHDGPAPMVEDFEDIVFPVRSANLQPPGLHNPRGAPYVNRLCNTPLDAIERGFQNGIYDLLSKEDMEEIRKSKSDVGSGSQTEEQKELKDGPETNSGMMSREFADRLTVEHYGRWDVDGDGLEEDVIFWIVKDSKKLAKAVLLSEMYPGVPLKRPFSHAAFIQIPNRVYGKCLDELLLSVQMMTQVVFDQHIDWGTITNTPMFFYRASSGMKPEPIYIEPGVGYPLDNPAQDVNFPNWPTKDSSYTVNTITLLQQFAERIQMFSDVSFGRVPTGKASALRTLGTTMSLLQQADVRSEQVLRRFFEAIAETYDTMHRLNRRFLPQKKEYRIVGVPEAGEEYQVIDSAKDQVDFEAEFEFKATLLNTNKQTMQATLQQAIALLISPLAMQAGIVTAEEIYNLFSDFLKAGDLPVDKYMKKPYLIDGPRISAEEVLNLITHGKVPTGTPLEQPEIHIQTIMQFMQSPEAMLLTPQEKIIVQQWLMKVQQVAMQQQMMAQAAGAMQGQMGQGGPGGEQTTIDNNATQSNPSVNSNELIDESAGMNQ